MSLKLKNGLFMPSEWKVELGALGVEKGERLLKLSGDQWEDSDWEEIFFVDYDGELLVFRV
jgi:hypothetical protein